jgi:hypothetical protein
MLWLQATVISDGAQNELLMKPGAKKYGRSLLREVTPETAQISRKIIGLTSTNRKHGSATFALANPRYQVRVVAGGVESVLVRSPALDPKTGKLRPQRVAFVLQKGDTVSLHRIQDPDGAWHDIPDRASFTIRMEALVESDSETEEGVSDSSFEADRKRNAEEMQDFVDDSEECSTHKDRRIIGDMVRHLGRTAPHHSLMPAIERELADGTEDSSVMKVIVTATATAASLLSGNERIEPSFPMLSDGVRKQAEQNMAAPPFKELKDKSRQAEERRSKLESMFARGK